MYYCDVSSVFYTKKEPKLLQYKVIKFANKTRVTVQQQVVELLVSGLANERHRT